MYNPYIIMIFIINRFFIIKKKYISVENYVILRNNSYFLMVEFSRRILIFYDF